MSAIETNQEKVPHLLRMITLFLAQWLEDKIANVNDDWWKLCVLPSLSYQLAFCEYLQQKCCKFFGVLEEGA